MSWKAENRTTKYRTLVEQPPCITSSFDIMKIQDIHVNEWKNRVWNLLFSPDKRPDMIFFGKELFINLVRHFILQRRADEEGDLIVASSNQFCENRT